MVLGIYHHCPSLDLVQVLVVVDLVQALEVVDSAWALEVAGEVWAPEVDEVWVPEVDEALEEEEVTQARQSRMPCDHGHLAGHKHCDTYNSRHH